MKSFLYWFWLLLVLTAIQTNPLYADDSSFGNMYISIDNQDSVRLGIRMAFLYRNVEVAYDSTILVQNDESSEIKLYPQISKGANNVLRIMAGDVQEKSPDFYDLFFILGDSLKEQINWINEREKIFITHNGLLQSQPVITDQINGEINFKREKEDKFVAGNLSLKFSAPLLNGKNVPNQIKLKGSFDLAVGEYRDLTIGKNLSDIDKKKKRRQNIYIAVFLTVFLVAIFGFR